MTTAVELPVPRAGLSMSDLVTLTGVAAATVRYYLNERLLPPPQRLATNRFVYDERHVELLRLIRLLRDRRRLPLETIRRVLPEMLPDLLGAPEGGVFHPEMWRQLLRPEVRFGTPSIATRLADAALEAFCSRGYSEVSVDDICRAAGIAKGSFYRHFASKEELLGTVVRLAAERVVSELRDEDAGTSSREISRGLLLGALAPYRTLLLDLAASASRGRGAASASLAAWFSAVGDALASRAGRAAEAPRTLLDAALASLLRGVAGEDPLPAAEPDR